MKGHRISSLPIAEFCAQAPRLSEQSGSGRAAAQSSAFHAWCAGDPDADKMLARLTDDEREQLKAWKMPAPVHVSDEITLYYADAEKEFTVALDERGDYTEDDDDALTVGHPDLAWCVEVDGQRVVYLVDMKRTSFTSNDGPESLQLHAYCQAYAAKHGADAYVPGEWILEEGQYRWGQMVDCYSPRAFALMERVLAAAGHSGEQYSTGSHCRSCWGRLQCPAHIVPVQDPESALAPFSKPDGLNPDNELRAVLSYQAASDLLKQVKDTLEAYAEQRGGIPDGNGKVWRKVSSPGGGSTFDVTRFKKENPQLVEQYQKKTGPRSLGFRWTKED